MPKGKLLVIDDEERLRKLLARILQLEDFDVLEASTAKEGLRKLEHEVVDVVISDVKLPDGNGIDLTKTIKAAYPAIEIIVLTAYGTINDGVMAIKNGAFDYITKGNDNDRIVPLLYQAYEKAMGQKRSAVKIKEKGAYTFDDIIGQSELIKQAVQLAQKIAPASANVLLLGETGTGKEVFANAIHLNSTRSSNSFVAINCSAFSRELLESELFGHKAGAFTGASKDKKGLIEVAEGGTIFLDEIGELHIDLQAKLLRVLENGEFIKLGDTRVSKANVRVIAATNRKLATHTREGKFREDLYYRLNVFSIELPPLRERKEDIP